MKPVIVARNLRKRYTGFAPVLRGVNIDVMPGELVAIMGPSGCGKSTMLHVLGLLHAPDDGTLSILDQDVLTFNREQTAAFRRGNLGFVMQASNLFDHSTVFENVEFPLIYENVPASERWPRVIRALELVRLTSRVHYPSNRLSGGEQQRVAIARAMVNNPRILMADEPTGALDQRTSRLIMENFRTLCHSGGVALVMVTHDAKMADYCDSIYTLEEGLLVCQRHNVPEISHEDTTHLLDGPSATLHTAMVSGNFLRQGGEAFRTEAHLLHNEGLLTNVVTLTGGSLLGKDMENYSLPMPVQHLGGFHALPVLAAWLGLPVATGHLSPEDRSKASTVRALVTGGRRWNVCKARVLARMAKKSGMECLYAAGGHRAPLVSWLASRIAGIPFAFEARTTDGWLTEGTGQDGVLTPRLRVFDVLARDALFVRCETRELCDALAAACPAAAGRIVFVPDPLTLVPTDEELPAAQNHEKKSVVHILCAGTMLPRKGFATLVLALARLKSQGLAFHLTMAGDGPELKKLRRLARERGIGEDVVFPGFVNHENMASLYLESDIFVAPGEVVPGQPSDGVPSSLSESMAFCLPVVATDLPGQAWLVRDGEDGFVVPQRGVEAMACAIEKLLSDAALRHSMGHAARERVLAMLAGEERSLARLFAPLMTGQSAVK